MKAWEPVGCFKFTGKSERITIELDVKRRAKYIYLKPTNFRTEPTDYSKHFNNPSIEFRFFGAKGTIVPQSEHILYQIILLN